MNKNLKKISVTELHLCRRCPRLMRAYRVERGARRRKDLAMTGVTGSGLNYGSVFHDEIAGSFFQDLGEAGNANREALALLLKEQPGDLARTLEDFIKLRYLLPFMKKKSRSYGVDDLLQLARGLQFWTRCLAEALAEIPPLFSAPEKALGQVFRPARTLLNASCELSDGRTLDISGQPDGLIFNPVTGKGTLFEFKGHAPSNAEEDATQAALYAWLLSKTSGLVPDVQILYLEDEPAPRRLDSEKVKALFETLPGLFQTAADAIEGREVPMAGDPALCRVCPLREGKADEPSRFLGVLDGLFSRSVPSPCPGPADAAESGPEKPLPSIPLAEKREVSPSATEPPSQPEAPLPAPLSPEAPPSDGEAQRLMDQLTGVLADFHVYVQPAGFICGPTFIRLKVLPDAARKTTVDKIIKRSDDLQVQLALDVAPVIMAQAGYVSVDVPRRQRGIVTLDELLQKGQATRPQSDAAFPLGIDVDEKVLWVDLANPSMTSLLIGGASGSGKSVLLRSIVRGLTASAPAGSCSFTLIDPKRVTFMDMQGLESIEGGRVIVDREEAMEKLLSLVDEMETRYESMAEVMVQDVAAYNRHPARKQFFKRRVVIVDEYADVVISDGKNEIPSMEQLLQRVAQKGRAAGIHLILATQRPEARIVTPKISANLPLRIALKVTSEGNSSIIFGSSLAPAQNLLGHGDMFVGGGVPVQRLQGACS